MAPELVNHPLARADGSATFTNNLFTILAAVNGPVDVSRRDEIPDAAAIEVNVRPVSGTGGPRERWMESVVASLLRTVVLVHMHPRTLIQVTLQITKDLDADAGGVRIRSAVKDVATIPALANAAFAALVDSGLPLGLTMVAGLACFVENKVTATEVTGPKLAVCESVHAMVFSGSETLLLDESAGKFSVEDWEKAESAVREYTEITLAPVGEDEAMADGQSEDVPWLRKALHDDARKAEAWRESG